jgi:hypothetical protein
MTRRFVAAMLGAPLVVGLLVGCGGASRAGSSSSAMALASSAAFPFGSLVSTAELNDLGPVTVTFWEGGNVTVEQGGAVITEGTYVVNGSEITVSDPHCKTYFGQETATYVWAWDGSTLRMHGAKDKCTDRATAVAEMIPPS